MEQLKNNNELIRKIVSDVERERLLDNIGASNTYKSEFSPRKPEYLDIWPVLGLAIEKSLLGFEGIQLIDRINKICLEAPEFFDVLSTVIQRSKINLQDIYKISKNQ